MTKPSARAQTCPSASSSDLKPSAIATRTTAAKTRKLRSRSVVTVVAGLVYRSSETGGVFIGPGKSTQQDRCSRARAPIAVLETHHVVDLRRRDLEDVGVIDCRDSVAGARGQVHRIALAHAHLLQRSVQPTDLDVDRPLTHEQPLVLALVVLKRKGLSLVHVDDLAQVAAGDRPADLVTPGLVDSRFLRARDLRHALWAKRWRGSARDSWSRWSRWEEPPSTGASALWYARARSAEGDDADG